MTRINNQNYLFEFEIENNQILLEKIINLDFLNIINELNKQDIFEDFYLEKHSENCATVYILFKHLFKDFGLPQKYAHLDIIFEKIDKQIFYKITTNNNLPKRNLRPIEAELIPISNVNTACEFINPHKVSVKTVSSFNKNMELPEFIERLATTIISKIFLRIKQFIEKILI